MNGDISIEGNRLQIANLSGTAGGGTVSVSGSAVTEIIRLSIGARRNVGARSSKWGAGRRGRQSFLERDDHCL